MYSQQVFKKEKEKKENRGGGGRTTLQRLDCTEALTRSHLKPGPRPSSSVNGQPQSSPAPPPASPAPPQVFSVLPPLWGLLKTRHRLCLRFPLSIQNKQSASSSGRTLGPLTKQSIILSAKPVWLPHSQGGQAADVQFSLCAPSLLPLTFSSPPSPAEMDFTTVA